MDVGKDEPSVDVVEQKSSPTKHKLRPVLVTSAKNNAGPPSGKLRTREITSRYNSGIISPKAGQTSPKPSTSNLQQALSAERRRPLTAPSPLSRRSAPSSPTSRESPPSTPFSKSSRPSSSLSPRSAPSSPTSRALPSSTPFSKSSRPSSPSSSPFAPFLSTTSRSTTPMRDSMVEKLSISRRSLVGRAPDGLWPSVRNLSTSLQSESSSAVASKSDRSIRNLSLDRMLSERKKTPIRGRNGSEQTGNSRPVGNSQLRAIDQLRWPGMVGGKVSSTSLLTRSMDLTDKVNRTASLPISFRRFSPARRMSMTDIDSEAIQNSTNEDAEPVSLSGSKKTQNVTSLPSVTRQNKSPSLVPIQIRPSSPNKALQTFSSRGMLSPSRTRSSTPFSSSSNTYTRPGFSSSILNCFGDMRKGSRSPSYTGDAHQLRLLYNRALQWRFVNARNDATFSIQKLMAEDMLYNVWNITSEKHDSVTLQRNDVENLRQEMELSLILKEQMVYLEDWRALEAEHSNSLSGIIQALQATMWRLPVKGGARADVRAVKSAIISAVDIMQAMGTSICSWISRVQGANSLVSQLCEVATAESIMLDECRELLASTAAMQVQECSLRTHLIQLRQGVPVD